MKYESIAFIFGILFFSNSAFSQQVIEGTVLDDDDNPIAGVNILLDKTAIGTVAGYDGHFKLTIENDPSSVLLLIRYIGYSPIDFHVNVEKGYNYRLKVTMKKGIKRRIKRNTPIEKVKAA